MCLDLDGGVVAKLAARGTTISLAYTWEGGRENNKKLYNHYLGGGGAKEGELRGSFKIVLDEKRD